jgi:hypothetical protein
MYSKVEGVENMQINKELTNKYYENYILCNCGDCRYFIKHIETEKTELCEYLRTLGINPLKPFELMSIYYEKDKRISGTVCNINCNNHNDIMQQQQS